MAWRDESTKRRVERNVRRIVFVAKYVLLPVQAGVLISTFIGLFSAPWWVLFLPTLLYLLHPFVVGLYNALSQVPGEPPRS